MSSAGLYVHVPFCLKKCDYCDFYSIADQSRMDDYVDAVIREIGRYDFTADTLYFGGGTPSQMSSAQYARIIDAVRGRLTDDCEITTEVNPGDDLDVLLPELRRLGVNRLSIGMQSANDNELKLLGRRHTFADVRRAVSTAKQCGFDNISLDVMLATESQTKQSLAATLDYACESGADHVSAYLLKVERGTPLFDRRDSVQLPDDDGQAEYYLFACDYLERRGFEHYEVSNFCRDGKRSRHNMKYWNGEPYIGVGPSAHSYLNGRRFYYPRDFAAFISSPSTVDDGGGGTLSEYVMLRLRLSDGVDANLLQDRFGVSAADVSKLTSRAKDFERAGLLTLNNNIISLTDSGFLVSNSLICELIETLPAE